MDNRSFESGAAVAAPPAPSVPSVGYPTGGNPAVPTPATKPGPYWFHQVGEELRAVLVAGGQAPDPGALTQLRDAIYAMIAAQTVFRKDYVINGGCKIDGGQGMIAAPSISSTPQYGKVEMWAAWATGTAVTAGTIDRDDAAPVGTTGSCLYLAGVTITGAGVVHARYRMESIDAVAFKNKASSFALRAHQNTGGDVSYTITVNKPTAADNYTAITNIGASAALVVHNNTDTLIKLEGQAMGDCSNGFEVDISAACGAVTAKNFRFADLIIVPNATAPAFEEVPIAADQQRSERYFEIQGGAFKAIEFGGYTHTVGSSSGNFALSFATRKRASPTVAKVGNWGLASNTNQPTVDGSGPTGYSLVCVGTANDSVQAAWTVDATTFITASSRL